MNTKQKVVTKMRRKMVFAALAVIVLLSLIPIPTNSWTYPDCTQDTRYEKFGPRADRLLIKLYANDVAEFEAFERCEIDMVDWHLPREYIDRWSTDPSIKIVYAGPEYGMYVIDINNNPNALLGNPPGYDSNGVWHGAPNPVYPNPCGVCCFRHALAHLMDRDYAVYVLEGYTGIPMYTMVPPSCGAFVHPDIVPGGVLEELCHLFNCTEAKRILDECDEAPADGKPDFPINGATGWRFWDRNGDGVEQPDEFLQLIFYIRSDQIFERNLGLWYANQIETCLQVRVDERLRTQPVCSIEVMQNHNFHLYTGYWRMPMDPYLLLSNPYHLHTLFHIDKYWWPGDCPNYNAVNCSNYNYWVDQLICANSMSDAQYAAYMAQEAFATPCCIGKIPVKCAVVYKAYKRCYSGGTGGVPVSPDDGENQYRCQDWKDVVNKPGFGIDNEYSFLNMYPEDHLMGDCEHMTIRWGFKTDLKMLNPLYAHSPHDWNVLHLIYESLLTRDPYTYELIPSKAKAFEVGTWRDPVDGMTKSRVNFTLRTDDCWHDGVPFSSADVRFTLYELPKLLSQAGLPPPWWIDNVRHVKGFRLIDPCNIEVLLDINSVWAAEWIGLNIILPKHIWLPLIESYMATGTPDPTGFSPDPYLIGNGPWRFVQYVPAVSVLLYANKPSLTIGTVHNPRGYRDWRPVHINVHIVNPPEYTYLQKFPNCTNVTFQIDIHNQWLNPIPNTAGSPNTGLLWVNKYVWIVYPNGTEEPIVYDEFVELPACQHHYENITKHFEPCHHQIKVAVHIKGPPVIEVTKEGGTIIIPNPWVCQWINQTYDFWVTIKEDICGDTWPITGEFTNVMGLPFKPGRCQYSVPDCYVNILDVVEASRAFGSYPGHARWDVRADINSDYKIDIKDIYGIAKKLGWGGPPPPKPGPVQLLVNPATQTVGIGSSFTVNIDIAMVSDLYGHEFKVSYNTTVLDCLQVIEGSFLKGSPPTRPTTWYPIVINEPGGIISISSALMSVPPNGVNGSGTLATITFNATAGGNTALDLFDTQLANSWHQPIGHTPVDGTIEVTKPCCDIAITKIISFKTVVGQGYNLTANITIINRGDYTVNFTLFSTCGFIRNLTLAPGAEITVNNTINTTKLRKGNYRLFALIPPCFCDPNPCDNIRIEGNFTVAMVGDLTGPAGYPDGKCDMRDVYLVAKGFGALHITDPNDPRHCQYWHTTPCGSCPHTPNADINNDGKIDMRDIYVVARNFGKKDP